MEVTTSGGFLIGTQVRIFIWERSRFLCVQVDFMEEKLNLMPARAGWALKM